eukprot:gene386-6800_t
MFDLVLREVKDKVFSFVAVYLTGVDPNHITLISLFFGILCAWSACYGYYITSIVMWNLNRIFDGLDGVVARIHKKQTKYGGVLDLYIDFIVYGIVPIAVVMNYDPSYKSFIALAFCESSYCINAVGWLTISVILTEKQTNDKKLTTIIMPTGLIEGTETYFIHQLIE